MHQKEAKKVKDMVEKMEETKKLDNLDVTLQMKRENGVIVTVSVKCSTWDKMQKFLSDFENTLLKGNNGYHL